MSIGRRLALGFGLLLAIMAGFAIVVQRMHLLAEQEYAEFVSDTEPRAQMARSLERSVLTAAISVRSYLAFPEPEFRRRMDQAFTLVRTRLEALTADARHSEDAALAEAILPGLDDYLSEVEALIASSRSGVGIGAADQRVTHSRERLLASVRALTLRLEQRTQAHLGAVGEALDKNARRLTVAAVLVLLLLAGLCLLVARSIQRPIQRLQESIQAWQDGNPGPVLALAGGDQPDRGGASEVRALGWAFAGAARRIDLRERRMAVDSGMCRAMAASLDAEQLSHSVLADIVDHVDAAGGLLYLWQAGESRLEFLAGHALAPQQARLALGEGLPGQAARERRAVVLRELPADNVYAIKLGYDQLPPRCVVALPVEFGDQLIGVLMLASARDIDDEHLDFLRSASTLLAIGLHNSLAHQRVVQLAADLTETNAEIVCVNEELQAQREELQAQSEELQAQNEEIQAQHEELAAQNQQLAETSASLRRRSDEVAAADQRKNDFLAVLAHELRNPMAPIVTSLALLRRLGPADDKATVALDAIERQTSHLTRLIEDLLDLTRISRGKVELQRQRMDLRELVSGSVDDYREAIKGRELELLCQLPSQPVYVHVDPDRIAQAIGNLLHNAMKFTPPGGRIEVELEQEGERAAVRVEDSGEGMGPDLLDRLFKPFSQGPTGLDRQNAGLGLGLALVKGLVEQHGGNIDAASAGSGQGSRFTLVLPVCRAAPADAAAMASDADDEPALDGVRQRILIADDNRDAANLLRMALEWDGHEVRAVYDGLSVQSEARAFGPDVVLCDIGLPGIDGYEVARRLRADAELRDVLLVAVTGYASGNDRESALAAGFDVHLAKPVDFERLTRALRSMRPGDRSGAF